MKNQFANDKEFMLALLAYNGTYLEHASEELKAFLISVVKKIF